MITQKTQLKIEIEKREFTFQCEPDSSLVQGYQALEILRSYYLGRIKDNEVKAEEAAKTNEVKEEEPKSE